MKVIVEPINLKKGMYVSELDRPWLDTPFLFQGFRITNDQEVEQIQSICDFVFVDTEKSTISVSNQPAANDKTVSQKDKQSTARIVKKAPPYAEQFEDEFPRALDIHRRAKKLLNSLFADVRIGKSLDVDETKRTVTMMVDSVLSNPDALVLLASMSNKSDDLAAHAITVSSLSIAFGRYIGFEKDELIDLGLGALLHDIGETKIPEELLSNINEASDDARALLQSHTSMGAMILQNLRGISDRAVAIARDHHERADGTGYPRNLTDPEIDAFTKLVSIVDTYDSVTSGTHGKEKISTDEALKCLYSWREYLFDPLLVEKFIQCIGIYPLGSVVELHSGHIGIVIASQPDIRLFPKVMLILDEDRKPVEPPQMMNLALFRDKAETNDYEVKWLVNAEEYGIDVRKFILRELPLG
jgi:putative nucleotidyltransferase with HDIG domain